MKTNISSSNLKDKTWEELLDILTDHRENIKKLQVIFDNNPTTKTATALSDAKNLDLATIEREVRRRHQYGKNEDFMLIAKLETLVATMRFVKFV